MHPASSGHAKPALKLLVLAAVLAAGIVLAPTRGADGLSPFGTGSPEPDRSLRAAKKKMYFADTGTNQVYVVQAKFRKKVKGMRLRQRIDGFKKPWGVALDPVAGDFLLVTNNARKRLSYVDTSSNEITAQVRVGRQPRGVAISPDGKHALVANFKSNSVSVIDVEALAAGNARTRPAVLANVKLKRRPSEVAVNTRPKPADEDRQVEFYVTNTASDVVSVIELTDLLDAIASGGNVNDAITHVNVASFCDLNGSIDSTPFGSVFSLLVYTCERGTLATMPGRQPREDDGGRDAEDEEGEENEDDELDQGAPGRSRAGHASRTVPFGFRVIGMPAGRVVSAVAQATPFANPTFGCATAAIFLGLTEPGGDASTGETYAYNFGAAPTRITDGFPFGPVFGGGGDSVYAHAACGKGCSYAKLGRQAATLTIPDAVDIRDGAMPPVAPPGGSC